ncbi:uncharacterized protein BDV17DRAFT_221915 [Aspergillus undulatus]|uniref:uncharacterized protein n=1 Tax=Aspergillus undulatus TaxID=1810928 RepID=UPI003CCCC4D7
MWICIDEVLLLAIGSTLRFICSTSSCCFNLPAPFIFYPCSLSSPEVWFGTLNLLSPSACHLSSQARLSLSLPTTASTPKPRFSSCPGSRESRFLSPIPAFSPLRIPTFDLFIDR